MIIPPVPQAAVDLVKQFEGCRLSRYSDIAGNATIGYGHLCKVGDGLDYIDETTAENLLRQDLLVSAAAVVRYTKVPLNENQYAALIDFAFNEGCGSLQRSIILQKVNRLEFSDLPKEFMRWVWAKGRRQKGLIARRQAEIDLFMST